jgi:hypothetical protein
VSIGYRVDRAFALLPPTQANASVGDFVAVPSLDVRIQTPTLIGCCLLKIGADA